MTADAAIERFKELCRNYFSRKYRKFTHGTDNIEIMFNMNK